MFVVSLVFMTAYFNVLYIVLKYATRERNELFLQHSSYHLSKMSFSSGVYMYYYVIKRNVIYIIDKLQVPVKERNNYF